MKNKSTQQSLTGISKPLFLIAAALSSLIYLLTSQVMKYRYKVIKKNLFVLFGSESEKKIVNTIKNYYQHLGDLVIEPFLYYLAGPRSRKKLATYTNPELLEGFYKKNKHVVLLASHYGNWEYLINLPKVVNFQVYTAYTPISNERINAWILKMRSSLGVKLIPKRNFYRGALSALKQHENPSLVVVIADQRPAMDSKHFVNFFGQKTRVQIGAEKLAVASDSAVVYLECTKKARFHYDYTFHVISEKPSEAPPMDITDAYYNRLESNIAKDPAHWLWSHDRWKGTPGV
ncbi:lysophospholipid acyltransferase family protein [Dyadobacter sp. LJ53]|uniref:lysophospholipid acyltransferase family protein n=1 Tax=Dyadobacter chenwenxiniae TaxID=2906456 RepID=UPI001F3E5038|nr:lysophospholipid acyltransferase family protein [Dyadobacter chenwenxiniae]MCF0050387.1 lysophospholipid acyltransferase family protein [Dyadobacter chenwenxiniae]